MDGYRKETNALLPGFPVFRCFKKFFSRLQLWMK